MIVMWLLSVGKLLFSGMHNMHMHMHAHMCMCMHMHIYLCMCMYVRGGLSTPF